MSTEGPSRKHVEQFEAEDDEYEYEYETSYLTLDLGNIDQNLLLNASTYRLVGLDTPTPYLQLPGITMKGTRETLVGSELIFTDGRDPNDRSRRFVVHQCSTSDRIAFHQVELTPKIDENASQAADDNDTGVPPTVLFQGPRKRKKVPKEKGLLSVDFDTETGRRKGQRGRPRGSGARVGIGRGGAKGKGKARASDSGSESGYEDIVADDDAPLEQGGESSAPVRTSTRVRKPIAPEPQNLEEFLGHLEAMEPDTMDVDET